MEIIGKNKLTEVFNLYDDEQKAKQQSYKYANDPLAWIKDAFGSDYVPVVPKIKQSVIDCLEHRYNLIYGVNSCGKSFCYDALVSLWWIFGRGKANAEVIILAGSSQQTMKAFRYMGQMMEINQERFRQRLTNINIDGRIVQEVKLRVGNRTVAFGRNPRQGENNKQAILGGHSSGGTLMICEESDGLSETMMLSAVRNITGKNDRLVAVTNPNDPDSFIGKTALWYEQMLDGADDVKPNEWHITQIGWKDMPTNPESKCYKKNLPSIQADNLLLPAWVEDMKDRYVNEPAMYNTLVLGRFDYVNKKSLITHYDINIAIDTNADTNADIISRPIIGLDLALFGQDNTVAYIAYDTKTEVTEHSDNTKPDDFGEEIHTCDDRCYNTTKTITRCRFLGHITSNDVGPRAQAKWIVDLAENNNASHIYFDAGGMGGPFRETLRDELTARGLDIIGVGLDGSKRDFAGASYKNDRAYWWGKCKERLLNGNIDLDPDDFIHSEYKNKDISMGKILIDELTKVGYTVDANDRICLESKKNMSKSPDYADAFVYAVMPRDEIEYVLNRNKKEPEKIVDMSDIDEDFADDFYDRFNIDDPFAVIGDPFMNILV
ncbi:MAG: hypothetical protein LBT91_02670 [Bifidobacteriaceae bacterium]|jgi:hypothetical protein|nr:hypothetical protein [Bifidobacteriaceae bacterium]